MSKKLHLMPSQIGMKRCCHVTKLYQQDLSPDIVLCHVQVPEDFDPSVLCPVDTSNQRLFEREFPETFLERWLQLRTKASPSSAHKN